VALRKPLPGPAGRLLPAGLYFWRSRDATVQRGNGFCPGTNRFTNCIPRRVCAFGSALDRLHARPAASQEWLSERQNCLRPGRLTCVKSQKILGRGASAVNLIRAGALSARRGSSRPWDALRDDWGLDATVFPGLLAADGLHPRSRRNRLAERGRGLSGSLRSGTGNVERSIETAARPSPVLFRGAQLGGKNPFRHSAQGGPRQLRRLAKPGNKVQRLAAGILAATTNPSWRWQPSICRAALCAGRPGFWFSIVEPTACRSTARPNTAESLPASSLFECRWPWRIRRFQPIRTPASEMPGWTWGSGIALPCLSLSDDGINLNSAARCLPH